MTKFKLTGPQVVILEALSYQHLTIADLATETQFSNSYVRAQIRLLEAAEKVERVDNRMPYLYRIPEESPFLLHRDKVAKYKNILGKDEESDNSFVKLLRKVPKSEWPVLNEDLRAMVEAIDRLEAQNKLVDTLEGVL